jgi:hypothetical protein
MELIKCAPSEVKMRFLEFLSKCWQQKNISESWKIAKVI